MCKLGAAGFSLCLLVLALTACSISGPSGRSFVPITAEQPKSDKTALEKASETCKASVRKKGLGSIYGLLTTMRPGALDEGYVRCMQNKGFRVEGEPVPDNGKAERGATESKASPKPGL